MLPRERVLKALEHEEPDIVPWGEHSIDYNIYEQILGRETLVAAKFRQTRALWEGRRSEVVASYQRDIPDLADALGLDIIMAPLMPSARAEQNPMAQVDKDTYRDRNGNLYRVSSATQDLLPFRMNQDGFTPPTLGSIREELNELNRHGVPEPDESVWEVVRQIVREKKKTHFVFTFWGGPGLPSYGLTDEDFYCNLILHPEMHASMAELRGRRTIASLTQVAGQGVDAIMLCADLGSSTGPLVNPAIFKEHVLPWEKKYVAEAHRLGLFVIKHCCGMVWDFVETFVEAGFDAYEGIQASAGMDMKLLKERVGDKLTLWGGVKNENLINGTPGDVEADARHALKWGGPGGGLIYGASHSLAVGTKPENLLAMKEAREKWGKYPFSLE